VAHTTSQNQTHDPSKHHDKLEYLSQSAASRRYFLPHFSALPLSREAGLYGPRQHRDGVQSVEQIIKDGYVAIRPRDPVQAILGDKKDTTWMGLDDAIHQIRDRCEAYQLNVEGLVQNELDLRNSSRQCDRRPGWEPEDDPEILQSLQAIDERQRQERLSLWRDISRLRSTVPEAAREYLSARRRIDILEDNEGGSA